MKMRLFPKQAKAIDVLEDDKTEAMLYGGAAGGGKTHLFAYYALKTCLKYPGSVGGIGRKELKKLKQTTLVTFFRIAATMGVLHTFKYNSQMSEIRFKNGSIIYLVELRKKPEDPDYTRLGSTEFSFFLVDEAGELEDERVFHILRTRIRFNLIYGIPKLGLSANPSKNFLKRIFVDATEKNTLPDHFKYIPAKATDNPELPASYIKALNELEGVDRERLLNGNWNYADSDKDLVSWVKIQDMFENEPVKSDKKYLSADIAGFGNDNFVLIYWIGWHAAYAWKIPKSSGKDIIDKVKEIKTLYQIPTSHIVYDGDGLGHALSGWMINAFRFQNNGKPIKDTDNFSKKYNRFEYDNLKTQCAYRLAYNVNAGIVTISKQVANLYRTMIEQEFQHLQRIKVDNDSILFIKSKEAIKESIGRSPDFLDNFIMRSIFDVRRY